MSEWEREFATREKWAASTMRGLLASAVDAVPMVIDADGVCATVDGAHLYPRDTSTLVWCIDWAGGGTGRLYNTGDDSLAAVWTLSVTGSYTAAVVDASFIESMCSVLEFARFVNQRGGGRDG